MRLQNAGRVRQGALVERGVICKHVSELELPSSFYFFLLLSLTWGCERGDGDKDNVHTLRMSSSAGIHAPRYSCLVLEDGLARERDPVTCEGAVARVEFNRGEQFEFLDEGAARVGMEFGQLVKKPQ